VFLYGQALAGQLVMSCSGLDMLTTQHRVELDNKSLASLCHSRGPQVDRGAVHTLAT